MHKAPKRRSSDAPVRSSTHMSCLEGQRNGGLYHIMLVLSRKINQSIVIGDNVRVVIVAIDRDQVKLGVEAPREVSVHREEIYEEIKRGGRPKEKPQ